MKETGSQNIASKRVLIDHIQKVYPFASTKKVQKDRSTTVTFYTGISMTAVEPTSTNVIHEPELK